MFFQTLNGNQVNLHIGRYRVNWRAATLSKFQSRVKKFFETYYSHLDWYEEVPLVGNGISRLRWDFMCIFESKGGVKERVFVEVQGSQHERQNLKFQKTQEDFENQLLKDQVKVIFSEINSKFRIIEFFEDDPPLTIKWFRETYPGILPEKQVDKTKESIRLRK